MAVSQALHFTNDGATAAEVREVYEHLVARRAGVLLTGTTPNDSMKVSERSGTANMSVDVADGSCVVPGTEASAQGFYLVEAPSTTNVIIEASDPTNARKDLIVVRIKDQDYTSGSPSTNTTTIEAIKGTAAPSPTLPTIPDNCLLLAIVDVAATVTTITDGVITDQRFDGNANHSAQDNGSAVLHGGICTGLSTARPTKFYAGMEFYETDTDLKYRHNGTAWSSEGVWQNYTPTSAGIGSPTMEAEYTRIGDTVHVRVHAVLAGAGTGSTIEIGLPVTAHTDSQNHRGFGMASGTDNSALRVYSAELLISPGGAAVTFYRSDDTGVVNAVWIGSSVPFVWVATDYIDFSITYRAA